MESFKMYGATWYWTGNGWSINPLNELTLFS